MEQAPRDEGLKVYVMPIAPPRACARCGKPYSGYCSECRKAKQQQRDHQRGTSEERGYDADWRVLRIRAFERDSWTCRDCGWQPAIVSDYQRIGIDELPASLAIMDELRLRQRAGGRHLQADHIQTIALRPDLRLELSNIQTLCSVCHAKKTSRDDGGFIVYKNRTTGGGYENP